ncbi:DUF2061 domain-containing protein [Achromobacter sp. F4_2707]|uniref:DUF2061 domain-containing protein n=1 Tax=Achromobacter sp. F4_2707 TaxID=3114286 RepID=UPI0039C74D7D
MSHIKLVLRNNRRTFVKTLSYYALHIVVAACVAFAVTGDWLAALTLSLLEPTVQAFAYFAHDKVWARLRLQRLRTLIKTGSYYAVHLIIATGVAYVVTGDLIAALTLSLLEPTVQMAFFYVHEKIWDRNAARETAGQMAVSLNPANS